MPIPNATEPAASPAQELAPKCTDAEWFEQFGMCGRCGDHGDDCYCTPADPCGCGDLHPMGSHFFTDRQWIELRGWDCVAQLSLFDVTTGGSIVLGR